jgi:hypothetical protein
VLEPAVDIHPILRAIAFATALLSPLSSRALGHLENPPDPPNTVSGVGLVSGWHCNATRIEIEFDGTARLPAAYGTDRPDTAIVCNGKRNTGFGLLLNWSDLGPGVHTVRAFADGVEFGMGTVTVVDLGASFLTGKAATTTVPQFPSEGRELVLEWREGLQGFMAKEVRVAPSLSGTWNGANLERRSNCTSSQNNGTRGTYAQWNVTVDSIGKTLKVVETTITGLACTYMGFYRIAGNRYEWFDGTLECSDGKQGTFHSTDVMVAKSAFSIRLATKLSGAETCEVDAILGGSRF